MCARFGMIHRSLYPALRVARSHYIFCSHAGQPLSVWDRRCPARSVCLSLQSRPLHPAANPLHILRLMHAEGPLSAYPSCLHRHMSGAVYEEEHLGNFPHAAICTGMPFSPPTRMARHQVSLLSGVCRSMQ